MYRKAELVECAVIPDSIFSLIIQSASAVCFLSHLLHNPAVCYHCFEQCVDAQSPNDCNFQLVGSTLFRKFLSKLIFQVPGFPGFHQHNSNYINSYSVPSVHHLFPSQGILSFSCYRHFPYSLKSGCVCSLNSRIKEEIHRWRYVFNHIWALPFGLAIDIDICFSAVWHQSWILLSATIAAEDVHVYIHCIMAQHCFLCCYSASQWWFMNSAVCYQCNSL